MTKAGHAMANGLRDLYVAEDWRAELSVSRGSTRSVERASYPCADLTCLLCGGPQLGLEVLDLNAKGLLKILRTQKPLHELSVGCNLPLNVFLEGAYLLLIGTWNVSHGPLDHINVGLRGNPHPFEVFKHHGSNGVEGVFFGFHVTLRAGVKREATRALGGLKGIK